MSNVNFFPGEINASDVVGLKTLILAAFGALNVHDYNNQMTSPQTRKKAQYSSVTMYPLGKFGLPKREEITRTQ